MSYFYWNQLWYHTLDRISHIPMCLPIHYPDKVYQLYHFTILKSHSQALLPSMFHSTCLPYYICTTIGKTQFVLFVQVTYPFMMQLNNVICNILFTCFIKLAFIISEYLISILFIFKRHFMPWQIMILTTIPA